MQPGFAGTQRLPVALVPGKETAHAAFKPCRLGQKQRFSRRKLLLLFALYARLSARFRR